MLQTGTWTALTLLMLIGLFLLMGLFALRGGLRVLVPGSVAPMRGGWPLLAIAGLACSLLGLGVGRSAGLPIPVGTAGFNGGLALDPLSCLFCLLIFALACFAETSPPSSRVAEGSRDLAIAASLQTVLAGDSFLLGSGAVLAMLALGACCRGRALTVYAMAAIGAAGACLLLSQRAAPAGGLPVDPGFAVLRAGAEGAASGVASGSGAALLPILAVIAAIPLLGLWPAQRLFRRQCAFAPVWTPVLGSLLGLFLLVRLLLDLAGPVPSVWWGAALMVLGIGSAVRAGIAGLAQDRPGAAIGGVVALQNGLAVGGIGLCLLAKADDLPLLAGAAFDAVLLFLPVLSLAGLAALGLARLMEQEAGSGPAKRLGGLAMSMPAACLLMTLPLGLLGFVAPAGGFAAAWLLLQCALSVPLPSIAGVAVVTGLLVTGIAVAASLGSAGLIRLAWVVALGRPRTPRGAAATDIGPESARRHGALLALPVLISLLPGLWLGFQDEPAHPLFWLLAPGGTALLAPLPILLAILLAVLSSVVVVRRLAVRGERREPAWEGGAPPPPPWLPFGDPATQIAPSSLAIALRQALLRRDGAGPGRAWVARPTMQAHLRTALLGPRAFGAAAGRMLSAHGDALAAAWVVAMLLAIAFGVLEPAAAMQGDAP